MLKLLILALSALSLASATANFLPSNDVVFKESMMSTNSIGPVAWDESYRTVYPVHDPLFKTCVKSCRQDSPFNCSGRSCAKRPRGACRRECYGLWLRYGQISKRFGSDVATFFKEDETQHHMSSHIVDHARNLGRRLSDDELDLDNSDIWANSQPDGVPTLTATSGPTEIVTGWSGKSKTKGAYFADHLKLMRFYLAKKKAAQIEINVAESQDVRTRIGLSKQNVKETLLGLLSNFKFLYADETLPTFQEIKKMVQTVAKHLQVDGKLYSGNNKELFTDGEVKKMCIQANPRIQYSG